MEKNNLFKVIPSVVIIIFFLSSPFFGADKRIVIFPFSYSGDPSKAYTGQVIKNMLITGLSGSGIEVIKDEQYGSLLNEKEKIGDISLERIKETAGKLKADFALFGSIASAGATSSIDISVFEINIKNSKPSKISDIAEEDQLIVKIADMALQIRANIQGVHISSRNNESKADTIKASSSTERPLSSLKIAGDIPVKNTQVMAFDIADLDGDGNAEWLIMDPKSLTIFSKENGTIVKKDSLESSFGETFLKVSAGDADGNRKPEIYIVTLYGSIVRTIVWEWSGKFNKLFNFSGNLRVIKDALLNKSILLFQDSGTDSPFTGKIYVMQYDKDGKLNRKEPLKQLNNVQFYTLTFIDFDNDGNMEYAGLDNNSCLHIWDKDGKSLWQGKDEMGGTNNLALMDTGNTEPRPDSPNPIIPLNSRLVIMDIDRDGKNEIIVVQNVPSLSISDRLKYYKKGYINVLKIDGKKLVFAWTSEEIDQCITEIQSDGWTLFFTTEDGRLATIFKGTSHIKWFD